MGTISWFEWIETLLIHPVYAPSPGISAAFPGIRRRRHPRERCAHPWASWTDEKSTPPEELASRGRRLCPGPNRPDRYMIALVSLDSVSTVPSSATRTRLDVTTGTSAGEPTRTSWARLR